MEALIFSLLELSHHMGGRPDKLIMRTVGKRMKAVAHITNAWEKQRNNGVSKENGDLENADKIVLASCHLLSVASF
jgi:hypothetical protein